MRYAQLSIHALCLLFIGAALGCQSGAKPVPVIPEGMLPRDTFVMMLTDVHIIEGVVKQGLLRNDDAEALMKGYYAELFARFDVSEARFIASYTWWYQQPEALDALLQEVTEMLTVTERKWVEEETAATRNRP